MGDFFNSNNKNHNNLDSFMCEKKQQQTIYTAQQSLGKMHDQLTGLINKQTEAERMSQLTKFQNEIDKRSNQGKYTQFK